MPQPSAVRRQRARWLVFVIVLSLAWSATASAVTVSWNVDTDGFWDVGTNWSTGMVPQPGQDVVIDRPAASVTVTVRTGTVTINSLTSTENVAITAGTLDLATASSLTTLTLSGGTLAGAGTVTVSGMLTWSGGTMTGTGMTNANGGLAVNANGVSLRAGRTFNNAGSATWSGSGAINNDSTVTFNNLDGASFAINTSADFSQGTFNNAGTVTKTAGGGDGVTRIIATFNNTKVVTVSSGELELANGGMHTGTFSVAGGATLSFSSGTHTLSGAASIGGAGIMSFTGGTTNFTGGTYAVTGTTRCVSGTHTFPLAATVTSVGTIEITGGTLNFSSGELITASTYTQSAGILTGTDTVTVTGTLTWTGGTMSGQGTTNANGGMLLTNTGSVLLRDTRILNNAGIATWSGAGSFANDTGAVFNNLMNATLNIQTTGDFFSGTINNAGAVTKTSGGGDGLSRITATLNNTGSVTVTSGTLELDSGGTHTGSFTVADGALLEFGGGTHTMSGNSSIVGMGHMRFGGGTTSFNAGTYNVTGITECAFGTHTFLGGATIMSVGALEIVGGTLSLSSGEIIATSSYVQSAGILTGNDTINVSGALMWMGGVMAGQGTVNANGGMQLTNPASVSLRDTRKLNNNGDALWTGAGSFSNDTGAVFNNANGASVAIQTSGDFFGGTFNNVGSLTKSTGGGDGSTRVSATFNNTGSVTIMSGSLELENGGTHSGSFAVADGATLAFDGGTHTMNAGASIAGAGRMRFSNGTTAYNAGTYNVTGATECAGGTNTFLGAATITSIGALTLGGGTLSLSSGELLTVPSYAQTGGTLTGNDTLNVNGVLMWSAGVMSGQGTTNANGGMQLTNASGIFLRDTRILNNGGAATWTGVGGWVNDTGAVFNNLQTGSLAIQTTSDIANGTINNAGTLTKTSGGGDGITAISGPFNNSGTVEVLSGVLRFDNSFTQTAGVTRLNGGSLGKTTAPPMAIDGGLLTGAGTVAANVKLSGRIAPGLPVGELTINGTYEQTDSGTLAVDLGGLTPVTQFDRLTITGSAKLAGTVDISLVNAFTPSDGNVFRVITFASETGDFGAVSGAAGFTHMTTSTFAELTFNGVSNGTATPTRTTTRTPTSTAVITATVAPTTTIAPTATVVPTTTATPTRTMTAAATATVGGVTGTPTPTGTSTPTPSPGFTVTRTHVPLPVAPVAAGDFGTDHIIDLAAGSNVEPKIVLLRNSGPASFTTGDDAVIPGGSGGVSDVVLADMNDDGHLDVVAANPDSALVAVALGNGQDELGTPQVVAVAAAPQRLAVGEMTGDTALDVAVATETNILILRGGGNGTLELIGSITTNARPTDLIVADVNGDGHGDVLAALPDRNLVALYPGDGKGAFSTGPSVTGDHPSALVLGRFTGGALPDLAVANANSIAVYPAVTGGFAATPIITSGVAASRIFAADVTGDGVLDLIAVTLNTGVARALPGDGTGHFIDAPSFAVDLGVPLGGAAFADLNGDSAIDLVMTDPVTQELLIALNRPAPMPTPTSTPRSMCVGDCNHNGIVVVDELITGVNIALERLPLERCSAFDRNGNLRVEVDELIQGVNNALHRCP